MTFDCYGTLLDWQSAFRRLVGDPEKVEAFHKAEPEVQSELGGVSYKAILRECGRRVGIDGDVLVEGWATVEPFPDTVAALTSLREGGWKLGILTNCDDDLFESTRAALGVPIDAVVTAERVGSYKPALGHFTRFEELTGVARADWVHAAVSWYHDMIPARALGLRRIWVDRERTGHDPAIVTKRVSDMASLAAYVR